jgi:hypothetical protein
MFGFVITADDRPGMVATATEAAARAGVNLRAISGMANGTTGMLALIGDDDAKLRAALAGTGLQVREVELVTIDAEDRVGSGAELARRLADRGVNLELLVQISHSGSRVEVAIGATDTAALRAALAQP